MTDAAEQLARWWRVPPVRQTLEDLKAFGDIARRLVVRGREAFEADEALPLAAEALIGRFGEGIRRLPDGLKADYPEVPWREIREMRNLLMHHYEIIDRDIVWGALANDVPELLRALGLDRVRDDGHDDVGP